MTGVPESSDGIDMEQVRSLVAESVRELALQAGLDADKLLVVGASSSEVRGRRIGTGGSSDIASAIVRGVLDVRAEWEFHLAFQSCEHLNRALVTERRTAQVFGFEEVSAVPAPGAGGAVAAAAYRVLEHPLLVESVRAHAGIDIGDTLIGMHLRAVAVPVRLAVRQIGSAHVNAARTRPRLIGGARAVYTLNDAEQT